MLRSFGIAVWRFDALEVLHKEVLPSPAAVRPAITMTGTRYDNQFKIFARLYQCVGKPHGRFGRHIPVQFPDHQHEPSLQEVRVVNVRVLRIMLSHRVSHPLLIP